MINIREVTKNFPSVVALDRLSLEIRQGEFFGLLGPNGAGKSTLMNLLVGYLNPDGGSITVAGEQVTQSNLGIRKRIGFVPQSLALYDELSALDNLKVFGSLFGIPARLLKDRIEMQLNAVELFERRKDRVKTFSGGMKRRLNMIASLLHDPDILLCDEPTVGVDPQSRNAIFDFLVSLNKQGKTIIYTTHYMEEAERLCSRIGIIDHGSIIGLGTTDELLEMLPYEETIIITKNPSTSQRVDILEKFGALLDVNEQFELKPAAGFTLSNFFLKIEECGIKYRWIELQRPTLEAVFLHLTGRKLRD